MRDGGCAVCGRPGHVQSHHTDYAQDATVDLCVECHQGVHRGAIRPDLRPLNHSWAAPGRRAVQLPVAEETRAFFLQLGFGPKGAGWTLDWIADALQEGRDLNELRHALHVALLRQTTSRKEVTVPG